VKAHPTAQAHWPISQFGHAENAFRLYWTIAELQVGLPEAVQAEHTDMVLGDDCINIERSNSCTITNQPRSINGIPIGLQLLCYSCDAAVVLTAQAIAQLCKAPTRSASAA
jgi:hypothetical protein